MGKTDEQFVQGGNTIADELVRFVDLGPNSTVFDLGCGYGRVAYALWARGHRARYVGIDILPKAIGWCQENMSPVTNGLYEFVLLDVENSRYNPNGTVRGDQVTFDLDFQPDVVVATSVFTHLYPTTVQRYLHEISRLLDTSGRVMATFFLINDSQQSCEDEGRSPYPLDNELTAFSRFWKLDNPLHVIGYKQDWVVEEANAAGLSVESIHLGSWCGRQDAEVYQDTLILRRS